MTTPLPPHDACFDIGNGNHYYWRRESVLLAIREALERVVQTAEGYGGLIGTDKLRAMLEDYK